MSPVDVFSSYVTFLQHCGCLFLLAAVGRGFLLSPFLRGSISIMDVLIFFFLEPEKTFSSQLVDPPHFTDEKSEPKACAASPGSHAASGRDGAIAWESRLLHSLMAA